MAEIKQLIIVTNAKNVILECPRGDGERIRKQHGLPKFDDVEPPYVNIRLEDLDKIIIL